MSEKQPMVSFFLENVGDLSYRGWIEKQLKKYSTRQLMQQVNNAVASLPDASPELGSQLQPLMMGWIDMTNAKFGRDKIFWQQAKCRDALSLIIGTAMQSLPIDEQIATPDDMFLPENQDLAWLLFHVPTLSFAYSASTQRAQRKFMGIRKGLFG